MRSTVIYGDRIEQYFTLKGIDVNPIYEKKVNDYNNVVIDSSFPYDITLSFPEYIFDIYKIVNNYTTARMDKVSSYINEKVYSKPFDENTYKDLCISLRKDNYSKVNVPYVSETGQIKIIQMKTDDIGPTSFNYLSRMKQYDKLRTVIFNETVLPFIKRLL